MGQAIARTAEACTDLNLRYVWTRSGQLADSAEDFGGVACDDLDKIAAAVDVLIDFSLPAASSQVFAAAARHQTPLVCGVSGLSEEYIKLLESAAASVPIVYDRNMSVGVAALEELVRLAAKSLGPSFEVEIRETHHLHKKDAPSGTALKLGESIAATRGQNFNEVAWYAPTAGSREISGGDIRFEVERRGDVCGDHTVVLKTTTERLELAHSVTTRQVFADGAIRAARWVVAQKPGLYAMKDVLFSRSAE